MHPSAPKNLERKSKSDVSVMWKENFYIILEYMYVCMYVCMYSCMYA